MLVITFVFKMENQIKYKGHATLFELGIKESTNSSYFFDLDSSVTFSNSNFSVFSKGSPLLFVGNSVIFLPCN